MNTSLVASAITLPTGHVLVNKKWQGTALGSLLSKDKLFIYSHGMGFIDFYTADTCPVVYVTEIDISRNEHTQKIQELAEVYRWRGVVISKRDENFADLQDLASVKLRMLTIPINDQEELPRILSQMAYTSSQSQYNPFLSANNPTEAASLATQLSILTNITNVGELGAKKLLSEFGNIKGVSMASATALRKIVGVSASKDIADFFKDESTT